LNVAGLLLNTSQRGQVEGRLTEEPEVFGGCSCADKEGGCLVEAVIGVSNGAEHPVDVDERPGVRDRSQELLSFVAGFAGGGGITSMIEA
jgi:hypothetical protein